MEKAYITNSTLSSLAWSLEHAEQNISMDMIWRELLFDMLNKVINQQEAKRIHIQKLLIQLKLDEIKVRPKFFNSSLVFSVGPPKFHRDLQCDYMGSDFINYEVPPQIKALGEDKVKEFQVYCESNRAEFDKLIANNRGDVFWARVGIKFGVTGINPEHILRENTGAIETTSLSKEEIRASLESHLCDMLNAEADSDKGPTIKKYKYAPSPAKALSAAGDDEVAKSIVEEFFEQKRKLINYLLDFYRRNAEVDGNILPVAKLMELGVEPCRACYGDNHRLIK